jgi:hypothetical protein
MSDFSEQLSKALQYTADKSTVDNLLHQLSQPEHDQTRWGQGDHTFRGVVADSLQDNGRDSEAQLLRGGGHVVVRDGQVLAGQFTPRHLNAAYQRVRDHSLRMTGDDNFPWTITERPGGLFAIQHPDHEEPEVYPAPEAQARLLTTLFQIGGLNPDGDWTEGWHEETASPGWKRLRRLMLAVRAAPIDEPAPEETRQ